MRYLASPSAILDLRQNRVETLSNMFQSITAEHHDHHLSEQQKSTLSDIIKRCQLILGEVRKKLDYYAEFDGTKNFRGVVQLFWKRFLWDEKEVTEFREQIR